MEVAARAWSGCEREFGQASATSHRNIRVGAPLCGWSGETIRTGSSREDGGGIADGSTAAANPEPRGPGGGASAGGGLEVHKGEKNSLPRHSAGPLGLVAMRAPYGVHSLIRRLTGGSDLQWRRRPPGR